MIKADAWDEFLDIWRRIVPVRRRHGFVGLFALADREQSVFTWAIEHPGDFDAAVAGYYADPERRALEIVDACVTSFEIRRVDRVPLPD
jgi:hypothetical protein